MNTAYIKVWGKLVGAVAWDNKTGLATFEYDSNFKKLNYDLSPLKMPIGSEKKKCKGNGFRGIVKINTSLVGICKNNLKTTQRWKHSQISHPNICRRKCGWN